MALSILQTQAVSELAQHLYDYLPGTSAWQGTYTFSNAASECGVGALWRGGSKLPALTALLEQTLGQRSDRFCVLVERIVANGLKYRARKGNPLTRSNIETLNGLVKTIGFKIPALWDPAFIGALPDTRPHPATQPVERVTRNDEAVRETNRETEALGKLRVQFLALQTSADRQAAGLTLERVLNEVFDLQGLEPNEPFRVVGEQIDGSFLLDSEVYLLEAKWTESQVGESDLLVFRGKVEGKSAFTRGLFISVNGFSLPGIQAITTGKQPIFMMMDGADLYRVLDRQLRLDSILRSKMRWLAEKGEPFVPASELFSNTAAM
jgi:hypothetical protein